MGLDFMLTGASWPDEFAPDWAALRAAARELPLALAEIVEEAHQLRELAAETDEEVRSMAIGEVLTGIDGLETALARGSRDLTALATSDGHTVLLDGGVSSGEEPNATWYWTESLTLTGLLGEPISVYGSYPLPEPVARTAHRLAEVAAPVGATRLAVAELPPQPDWERGRAIAPAQDLPGLERLQQVLAGGYSRVAAVRRVGDRALFVGDRALPGGAAAAIGAWERSGVLAGLGGRVLRDVRTAEPTTGAPGKAAERGRP